MKLIYIQLYKNKITIESTRKRERVTFPSKNNFSNSRMIIANHDMAVNFLRTCIVDNNYEGGLVKSDFIIHIKDLYFEDFCSVEFKSILSVAYHAGAKKAFVYTGEDIILDNIDQKFLKELEKEAEKYN